ncbi:hypothetical protein D3C75_432640 [compost metagenome]
MAFIFIFIGLNLLSSSKSLNTAETPLTYCSEITESLDLVAILIDTLKHCFLYLLSFSFPSCFSLLVFDRFLVKFPPVKKASRTKPRAVMIISNGIINALNAVFPP